MLLFPKNKKQYKILILGDVQAHGMIKDKEKTSLKRLVDYAEPDLVVFLGDMISGIGGYTRAKLTRMINAILDSTVGTTIPFAIVSGNHESFSTLTFAKQIEIYRKHHNCLTPPRHERKCRKAYTLDLSISGKKPMLRLLFIDCAGSKATSLGQVYKKTCPATLKYCRDVLSGPDCPSTVVFQHIIVPEVKYLIKTHDKDSGIGVRGSGPFRGFNVSLANSTAGILGRCPCPAWSDAQQFAGWIKSKKVVAGVFAHDHLNSFEDNFMNIKLIQCSSAGFECYGDDDIRGTRIINVSRSGKVSSEPVFYKDLL